MNTVYIIDDDITMAELLRLTVENIGLNAHSFTSAFDFFHITADTTDIILLDLNMPDIDGIEVIRTLAKNRCPARLILISGHDKGVLHSAQQLAQAHLLNVATSLTKPIKISELQSIILKLTFKLSRTDKAEQNPNLIPTVEELRHAINSNELILHYQPQIDMNSKKLRGVEALVRWQHPDRGLIYPEFFIALAEQNNLIGELTAAVIALSIEQQCKWQECGFKTRISVNISSKNITSLSLPEQLSSMLSDNLIDSTMLTLEITESELMGELVTSLDILTRLRMKGFGLSIDDFGTGYSSLSQLHKIPFTELKIDQSFIISMEHDIQSRAIVKTCILLGHELNMEIVAEGVESQEIFDSLKLLGCDIAQGYHIAKPMPANELMEWASNNT